RFKLGVLPARLTAAKAATEPIARNPSLDLRPAASSIRKDALPRFRSLGINASLHDFFVGRDGQECLEGPRCRQLAEDVDSLLEAARGKALGTDFVLHALHFLGETALEKIERDLLTVVEPSPETQPLTNLRARNLGGRCIFRDMRNRHRSPPAEPGFDILHAYPDVLAKPRLALGPLMDLEQILLSDRNIIARPIELVGTRHQPIEYLHRDRYEVGMGYPGAVMAV